MWHLLSHSKLLFKVKYKNYKVYSNIAANQKGSNKITTKECNHLCLCPIKGIIDIIGKKWALLIINALRNQEKLRFNDIQKQLEGISPKTLSDTLKELQAEGIIQRVAYAEIPPRVEYSLSNDGSELGKAIVPLIKWAANREHRGTCFSKTCHQNNSHHIKDSTKENTKKP
ncbi:MAG: winged helix-turn-helix transcriptional regulator [Candidatus Bathyarchaeia archaeon]|jgi:DNA-binding HxlR family transcriptional regulator